MPRVQEDVPQYELLVQAQAGRAQARCEQTANKEGRNTRVHADDNSGWQVLVQHLLQGVPRTLKSATALHDQAQEDLSE